MKKSEIFEKKNFVRNFIFQNPLLTFLSDFRFCYCRKKSSKNWDFKIQYDAFLHASHGYGSYPERYRSFIWRALLEIPGNEACFTTLVQRGVHPNWKNIGEKFQIKSPRLIRILEKIVSALAYWSEIFAELEYLPMLVFPFVKVFQHNHLVCFEVVATYLKSFCVHWFEFFPNPPIGVLSVIENVIAENDRQIFHHLVESKITSQTYAWPILPWFQKNIVKPWCEANSRKNTQACCWRIGSRSKSGFF